MSEWINKQALLEQIGIDSDGSPGWYGDEWKFIDTINNMPVRSDLISRCELFNRLATIPAPAEANEFKAEIYEVIQSMETADVAYICDREKCEHCDPRCDLTRDKEHAATTEKVVLLDGISRPQGEWIRTGRTNIYGGIEVQCSNCGDKVMVQHLEDEWYCRHCGADMGMKGADDE